MRRKLALFSKQDSKAITFSEGRGRDPIAYYALLFLFIGILFSVLIIRLFTLSIVKGVYYGSIAQNNRLKEVVLPARRGTIYDRNNVPIVESKSLHTQFQRGYVFGPAFGHIVGYIQQANPDELTSDMCERSLISGDKVGKKGIELLLDCSLRGTKGVRLLETTAQGTVQRVISQVDSIPGDDAYTALDSTIQNDIYESISKNTIQLSKDVDLSKQKIAVVATIPSTGEVLSIVSYPSFDPNAFETSSNDLIHSYLTDEGKPLFNRALLGTYPPGSVFKPLLAAGALHDGLIDSSFEVDDTGELKAGKSVFGNWYYIKYGKKEGMVDVIKSLQRSNDIFYYTVGGLLKADGIKKWAEKFGYGKKTGIGLDEAEGVVPTDFWKKETIGERWYLGDTYNLSIGQGYLLATPLQVHMANTVFANDGKLCSPQLLKVGVNGITARCHDLGLGKEVVDMVRQGMKKACEPGGTGWPFFTWKLPDGTVIPIGCKTGTAESKKKGELPHAWFTVFAPFDHPSIAVTVMVEDAGEGSDIAAPIAKEILTRYFERILHR